MWKSVGLNLVMGIVNKRPNWTKFSFRIVKIKIRLHKACQIPNLDENRMYKLLVKFVSAGVILSLVLYRVSVYQGKRFSFLPRRGVLDINKTVPGSSYQTTLKPLRVKAVRLAGHPPLPKVWTNCSEANSTQEGHILTANSTVPSWEYLVNTLSGKLQPGGSFVPQHGTTTPRLAVIIPYRDREDHLKLFLQHMHPFLQDQNLLYTIFVVELEKNVIFKKGLLMNIGFIESLKVDNFTCYVFHDVDMLPLHPDIHYTCKRNIIVHMSTYVQQYNYTKPYAGYIGGVVMFHKKVFQAVNGFSNLYWGWGGEDDDMMFRVHHIKVAILSAKSRCYRYSSWSHDRDSPFQNRIEFIRKAVERMYEDGLNSAANMSQVLKIEQLPLYTWIYVSANQSNISYKNIIPVYGKKRTMRP